MARMRLIWGRLQGREPCLRLQVFHHGTGRPRERRLKPSLIGLTSGKGVEKPMG
jgi:hypothetical protein